MLQRAALLVAAVGAVSVFAPARAFAQTAEGTVISNTASVSWTDANNNTYSTVRSTAVTVTVGFTAGVSVASPATVTPASPSSGNSLNFTITNTGNGTDSVTVATVAGVGLTITGYAIGATNYASLAALNLALSALPIAQAGTVVVTVKYDVASGRGGTTSTIQLTANSRRTPATTASSTTNVNPPVAASVAVTPDGTAITQLPSNGTQYTAVFTITNNGNAADSYNLVASIPGGLGAIVSVNGTAGSSGTVGPIAATGGVTTVNVVYTIGNFAAGVSGSLQLTATSQASPAVNDPGNYVVTIVRPTLTITKAAFRDDQTTLINGALKVLPAEFIQYKITVTNAGTSGAVSVSVSDVLPAQVTYQSSAGDLAGWTLGQAAGTVTGTLSGTLGVGASRFFWIRVKIN